MGDVNDADAIADESASWKCKCFYAKRGKRLCKTCDHPYTMRRRSRDAGGRQPVGGKERREADEELGGIHRRVRHDARITSGTGGTPTRRMHCRKHSLVRG